MGMVIDQEVYISVSPIEVGRPPLILWGSILSLRQALHGLWDCISESRGAAPGGGRHVEWHVAPLKATSTLYR